MIRIYWLLLLVLLCSLSSAKISLPPQYSSNAVLQRDTLVNIVGGTTEVEDSSVTLTIVETQETFTTKVRNSRFKIEISPHRAGGPYTFTLNDKSSSVVLHNILFGDVWVCSGQSNMQFTVNMAYNSTEEIATANYPHIRVLTVKQEEADTPQPVVHTYMSEPWNSATPQTIGGPNYQYFSAVCYFFGKKLFNSLNGTVPIGLLATSYGGTIVEAWMSPDALAKCKHHNKHHADAHLPRKTNNPNRPSVLWNAMVHPLLDYRIKGAIWYQGESNAGNPTEYACNFPAMIQDWRQKFNNPSFPFHFVQLAPWADAGGKFPALRVAQLAALALPNTGVAVAIDLGDRSSPHHPIHPRDKQHVGLRLAYNALAKDYSFNIPFMGPVALNATQVGSTIVVRFTNNGLNQGLYFGPTEQCVSCCNTQNKDFELLINGKWVPAPIVKAKDATIVVIGGVEAQATAVRFDWSDYPNCALYNDAGLPSSPFTLQMN